MLLATSKSKRGKKLLIISITREDLTKLPLFMETGHLIQKSLKVSPRGLKDWGIYILCADSKEGIRRRLHIRGAIKFLEKISTTPPIDLRPQSERK